MSGIWRRIQCRVFSNHRWIQKRVDGETFFVCADCRKRYFGSSPPEGDERVFLGGSNV